MKVHIGEYGAKNLRRHGYCVAGRPEDDELLIIEYASAGISHTSGSGPDEPVEECTVNVRFYCYSCGSLFAVKKSTCPQCNVVNASERIGRQQYGDPDGRLIIEEGDLTED